MIIVNTTFVIDRVLMDAFILQLREQFVDSAMDSGIFTSWRLAQIVNNDDPTAVSLACELTSESITQASHWLKEIGDPVLTAMAAQWGDRLLWFRTILKRIDGRL